MASVTVVTASMVATAARSSTVPSSTGTAQPGNSTASPAFSNRSSTYASAAVVNTVGENAAIRISRCSFALQRRRRSGPDINVTWAMLHSYERS
ncbi:MAG: hypothetical protein KKC14_09020 [Alphaproteobacteria bacterium]|nr:hypothetical protein [Alphaproteobacteria bacterium]